MIIYLPLLIALVGLVMFLAVRSNGDIKEVGKIMFFCGLLAFLIVMPGGANHAYHLP